MLLGAVLVVSCGRDPVVTPPAVMIDIPGAEIALGCGALKPRPEYCQAADSYPRVVRVAPFAIARLEVTVGEYRRCVAAGRCSKLLGTAMPAELPALVNWDQATAYCHWQGARLPTDAEWELAARGTDRRTHPWGERAPTCDDVRYARVGVCTGYDAPHRGLVPGGQYPNDRSPYGVMDMAGNATEWTADPMTLNNYPASVRVDHPRFGVKSVRGAADAAPPCCPLYSRVGREAVSGSPQTWNTGFRCAR